MKNNVFVARYVRALAAATSSVAIITALPSGTAQVSNTAAEEADISIPAGPMSETLSSLSDVFGIVINAPDEMTSGKATPAISGQLSPEGALRQALYASGLEATAMANGQFTLVQLAYEAPETQASEDDERIENVIIITGTKLGQSLQETTSSVELFDAERLENEVLFTLGDALSRSPNTSVVGNNINNINIRGINRNGTGGAGQGEAINIFVDGAPISSAGLNGINTLWDTEQVEILRGSQSTVQGRNAIAGAVIVESKKPSFDWEGAARVRFAEFGTQQYSGVVSGPIIEDQLAFRFSADYQETDGIITDGFNGEDDNFQESLTLRGRVLVEPKAIDRLSGLFTFEYVDRENGRVNPIALSPDPDFFEDDSPLNRDDVVVDPFFFDNFDPDNRITFPLLSANLDIETIKGIGDITYDLTDSITLKFIGTYEDTKSISTNSRNGLSQFAEVGTISDADNVTYTAEARAQFDFDKLSGLIGGYYFKFESDSLQTALNLIRNSVPFPITPEDSVIAFNQVFEQEVENFAFFTSWRFEPNEKWDIDFGLRYDNEEFTTAREVLDFTITPENCTSQIPGFLVGAPTPLVDISCTIGGELLRPPVEPLQSDSFDAILPNGAVTYSFNPDLSVFAGVRRGYRAGGTFLASSTQNADPFRVVVFDPEFLLSYEAGWRSQWLNKKLTLNGTAFFSDYKDQQVNIIDEEGFSNTLNAGETSLYGLELSADYQATRNLNIYGSLGLLETDVDEFLFEADDPDEPGDQSIDLAGNDLDRSPNVSFTIGTDYAHESGLFGNISLNYQSSYESDIFNLGPDELLDGLTERIGPSVLVNARFGYEYRNFVFTVFATNLLGEDEPELVNLAATNALRTPGDLAPVQSFTLRQPQTFGISLDASF
ncbi:MAG: TonB-dependent receptor [Pseudomonadota bacterium]